MRGTGALPTYLTHLTYLTCLTSYSLTNLHHYIFGEDFKAFVLVFPDDGGIELEQAGGELAAGAGEERFGFFGGLLVGAIVIAGAFALAIVPVRDGVYGRVLQGPMFQVTTDGLGDFVEGDECVVAMLADQAGFANIAGQERKHGRTATRGFQKCGRRGGEAFEPNLAFVADGRRERVRAEQRVREAPGFAADLTERLGEPAREGEVVKLAKDLAVLVPKLVER
jgi:hypothetical protein